jgi:hypothetical protein
MTEMRGNWEADRSILGWTRMPAERTCRYCRRSVMHTKAEHDLVHPVDREVELAWDREETRRQTEADARLLDQFIRDGMTEDEAADELWRWMAQGKGLVETRPRP